MIHACLSLFVCRFLLLLAGDEKSGNASDSDAPLRWSQPGIVCEPIVPTPAVMRTHSPWWARSRGSALRSICKLKHLDILSTPVGHPGAAKRSTSHIHPPDR